MQLTSWQRVRPVPACMRTTRSIIGLSLLLGCDDGGEQAEVVPSDAPATGVFLAPDAAGAGNPRVTTIEPDSGADASMVSPTSTTASPAAALRTVAADGVTGALVPAPFLSDAGNGRRHLLAVDWEIPAHSEHYLCGRVTVPEDVYLSAVQAMSPPGTHHTVVTIVQSPNAGDGVNACDASEVGTQNVGGSGVGTPSRRMPEGFAAKLPRGAQILLNLHLFNVTDQPLRGRSGTEVETTVLENVKTLVDSVNAGPVRLSVPPGRSVQNGVCTVDHDYTVYSVFPHMHQMGVSMKAVARRPDRGDVVIYDGPYDFENQLFYRFDPIELKTGDKIEVECTYNNTSTRILHFGESTNDEMCFAGLGRYPAGGKSTCPN
jgi:hypothetical protein